MKQSKREVVRFYDKGLESGNESYHDVIRHEEQLRAGLAGYLVNVSGAVPTLNVPAALHQMNKRFYGWSASPNAESHDIGRVLRENGAIGGAALALAKFPEMDYTFKENYSDSMYYRAKRLAGEIKRSLVTVDFTVPEDAWLEPMVL